MNSPTGTEFRTSAAPAGLALVVLLVATLLAIAVRLDGIEQIIDGDDVAMRHADAHYHLTLARRFAEGGPTLWLDPQLNYPEGCERSYPVGFSAVLALPSLWGADAAVSLWAAYAPVWLGVLGLWVTAALTWAAAGPLAAAFVGAFVSLSPAAINVSSIGSADHHAIIAPITMLAALLTLLATGAQRPRNAAVFGALGGVASASSILFWPISPPAFHAVVCAFLALLLIRRERDRATEMTSMAFGISSAIAALVIVATTGTTLGSWISYAPSYFTAFPFVLAGVVLVVAPLVAPRHLPAVVALTALGGAAAGLLIDGLRESLTHIVTVASGNSTQFEVMEARGLLSSPGRHPLSAAFGMYSPAFLLVPIALIIAVREAFGSSGKVREASLVLTAGGAALVLSLLQIRFAEYAVYAFPLTLAWAGAQLSRQSPALLVRVGLGASAALAIGWFAPALASRLERPAAEAELALAWVDEVGAVVAAAPVDAHGRHSMLTLWDHSTAIAVRTPIAVTSSVFSTPNNKVAYHRTTRALLTTDATERERLLDEADVRWVLLPALTAFESLAAAAELDPPAMQEVSYTELGTQYETFAKPEFWQTLYGRLDVADGGMGPIGRHAVTGDVGLWRLAWESESRMTVFGAEVPSMRLFERVDGVELAGSAQARATVRVDIPVTTSRGRSFAWVGLTTANDDGRWSLRVPYTEGSRDGVTAGAPQIVELPLQ